MREAVEEEKYLRILETNSTCASLTDFYRATLAGPGQTRLSEEDNLTSPVHRISFGGVTINLDF